MALQVEDQEAYTFSLAEVTRWPFRVVPSEENCRKEFALFVPESYEPTFRVFSVDRSAL